MFRVLDNGERRRIFTSSLNMEFLRSLAPLVTLILTLLVILGFMWALVRILHYKTESILTSINKVVKLEIRDPIGRICLVALVVMLVTFVMCFVSDEVFNFAAKLLHPELVSHSINLNMMVIVIAFMFVGNLVVLAYLRGQNKK